MPCFGMVGQHGSGRAELMEYWTAERVTPCKVCWASKQVRHVSGLKIKNYKLTAGWSNYPCMSKIEEEGIVDTQHRHKISNLRSFGGLSGFNPSR